MADVILQPKYSISSKNDLEDSRLLDKLISHLNQVGFLGYKSEVGKDVVFLDVVVERADGKSNLIMVPLSERINRCDLSLRNRPNRFRDSEKASTLQSVTQLEDGITFTLSNVGEYELVEYTIMYSPPKSN